MEMDSRGNGRRARGTEMASVIGPGFSGRYQQPVSDVRQSAIGSRASVSVSISYLSLDGFSLHPGQERQVRVAIEKELGRLLAMDKLPGRLYRGGAVPILSGKALEISSWKDPADLGRQIASALYGGLQR
jgi:hypothetical protein